jgi:hypothetical protein
MRAVDPSRDEAVERLAAAFYLKMNHIDPIGDPSWEELTDDDRRKYIDCMEFVFDHSDLVRRLI